MLHGCSSSNANADPKVRVPEPKSFSGNRNAKELENFLWDMEQFFKAARVPRKSPSPACILWGVRNSGGLLGLEKTQRQEGPKLLSG